MRSFGVYMAEKQRHHRLASLTVCAALVLYAIPYVAGWLTAHEWPLPPLVSDHTYFYVLSAELHTSNGTAVNPWYGNPFPENDHPYRRFGVATVLFRLLSRAVDSIVATAGELAGHSPPGQNLALTVMIWNAVWIALTAIMAWLLFSSNSRANGSGIMTASAILLLVSFPHLLQALNTIRHGHVPSLSLPFLRLFYPQTIAPIVLGYLFAAIDASRKDRAVQWGVMGLLQAVALMIFPYAVIILAGTTAVTVILSRRVTRNLVFFAAGCALIDVILLRYAGAPTLGAEKSSFFAFQPAWPNRFQMVLSLLILSMTIIVAFVESDRVTRSVICGFGIAASAIPTVADSLIARPVEASIHLYYLADLAIGILAGWAAMSAHRKALLRAALAVSICVGLLAATSDAERPGRLNQQLGEVVRWSRAVGLSDRDLVISRSEFDDQPASYLPLLGNPNILFYYYGEYFVPISAPAEHWDRLAAYLYLKGETIGSLRSLLSEPALAFRPESYVLGHRWLRLIEQPETRDRALAIVENELLPRLAALEKRPAQIRERFERFARVFVIDDPHAPAFSKQRLAESLRFATTSRVGSLEIVEARPR
jgi:hypothetical protein